MNYAKIARANKDRKAKTTDELLKKTFDNIEANSSIIILERSNQNLSIFYKDQYCFNINFDSHRLQFKIEFSGSVFKLENISFSRLNDIDNLLQSLINSHNQYH
jgi:hypothetical protein